jgi:hypothetical protein
VNVGIREFSEKSLNAKVHASPEASDIELKGGIILDNAFDSREIHSANHIASIGELDFSPLNSSHT